MPLKKKGNRWQGSSATDLDEYLLRRVLGRHCSGAPHRVVHARCESCRAGKFLLFVDDGERILRVCTVCQAEHKVCDLDGKYDAETAGEIVCPCMYSECEVAIGFALMEPPEGGAEDDGEVCHLYVAGRCTQCGLCGVYSEWGPEGDFPFPNLAKSV